MTIEELLTWLRLLHIAITHDRRGRLVLWSPNKEIPLTIRRAFNSYRQEIQRMIAEGRIETCENFDLHRQYWSFRGQQRYVCEVCERLSA